MEEPNENDMKASGQFASLRGERLTVGSNTPFLLRGEETAWLIEEGVVDVFSVEVADGVPSGTRSHLARFSSGTVLLGMPDEISPMGLLAVGAIGTRVIQTTFSDLQSEFTGSDFVETWVSKLMGGLCSTLKRPREVTLLDPGSVDAEPDEVFYAKKKLCWLRSDAGSFRLCGQEDWVISDASKGVPLAPGTWVITQEAGLLEVSSNSDQRSTEIQETLASFHATFLDFVTVERRKRTQEELLREKQRERSDEQRMGNAMSKLSFVLKPGKYESTALADESAPLLGACRMIGVAMRIRIKAPDSEEAPDAPPELRDIARASRFRYREVMLKEEWWGKDNGPLLAFIDKEKCPVALLPTKPGQYHLHRGDTGDGKEVTSEVSKSLSPRAWMFYGGFPERPVTGIDLCKMGMFGSWWDLSMVFIMGLCGSLLGLLTPILTGIVFDSIVPDAARGQLVQVAFILIAASLAAAVFEITKGIALLRVEGKVDGRLQAALWDRLLALPVPFFRQFTSGDLAKRSMGINGIRTILSGVTVTAILGGIFSSVNFLLLFYYDWELALVAMGMVFIGLVVILICSWLQVRLQRSIMRIEGENASMILQFISGVSKLRMTGTEDRAFAEWSNSFSEKKALGFKSGQVQNILDSFNAVFPVAVSMALFAWVVFQGSELTTGRFLAFNSAYASYQNALFQMAIALTTSLNIIPIFARVRPLLEATPETDDSKASPGSLSGRISVSHVDFRYNEDGPLILKDVSLEINPGEFVAIVGGSGSGKSTLLRLLMGFNTPESGTLYFDDQDLDTLDIQDVRRQTGVVLQNGKIMGGSIFRNITGISNLTVDDAWEAARMVGFDKDIEDMPMKMHTVIPAGGGTLSGGQRQRLIIARAIVHRPRILFFDEATSALDNQTQATVSHSLEQLHATRIVIAHRLSTIINADRIYVLQHGELVQQGTYDELMQQDGFFAEQARRQIV